jgi:hypothetical protein
MEIVAVSINNRDTESKGMLAVERNSEKNLFHFVRNFVTDTNTS